jgi:hypothetical protein
MIWITNHPKPLKGMWPRRVGCTYIEGEPKATFVYTVEQLKEQGLVGVYVDMPVEEYEQLPLAKSMLDFLFIQEALAMSKTSTMNTKKPGCTAFHAADTCERLDPLAGGQASVLAIMHNDAHGYDKTFPCNMGVTTRAV